MAKYYYKDGFTSDTCAAGSGLRKFGAASVSITKGQALHDDGTGYATNATTAFANTFLGIAASDIDNSTGSKGDLNIFVIPPRQDYKFWVKVEADALITQTAIGTIVDLEANDSIDISDTTCVAWGCQIIEIDVSTAAKAANAYGYAKVQFVVMDQD